MTTPRTAAISPQRLHELLVLDHATGQLTNRVARKGKGMHKGAIVGHKNRGGYLALWVDRRLYAAHRVVFAMAHGRWPADYIDHINGVRDDNRPANLREVTASQNNSSRIGFGASGRMGVTWHKQCGKWQVSIQHKGKSQYLGLFVDLDAAARAYEAAAMRVHGEFIRRNAAPRMTTGAQP